MELSINNVGKKYKGDFWAVKDFTLNIGNGVLGLLGPNGAGKSTLMRMIATVMKPTEGSITWNGEDVIKNPNSIRKVLGYLPQDFGVYPNLNAIEFLEYIAAMKGITGSNLKKRIRQLIEITNLANAAKRPIGSYSGGMKQRVGIAQALLNDPKLLIIDEPTVGLDPEERVRFRDILTDISENRIVIFSTHIVSDVEAAASNIAIMNKGNLFCNDSPENLLKKIENKVWECVIPSAKLAELKNKYVISRTVRHSDGIHVRIVSDGHPNGGRRLNPQLEDAYLYLTTNKEKRFSA